MRMQGRVRCDWARTLLWVSVLWSLSPDMARAWIFPEHAEMTRFALERYLPAPARLEIEKAVKAARDQGIALCEDLTIPLHRVMDQKPDCVPYAVLPALAGDHAVDEEDLRKFIKEGHALEVLMVVADRWQDFLDEASPEVQRLYRSRSRLRSDRQPETLHEGGYQRLFTRELDLKLQSRDSDYADRSDGSSAHFQSSMVSASDLLSELVAGGNADNALAQVISLQMRSLQLAAQGARTKAGPERDALWAEALLAHAGALHFLQDAFAAGHMGTEQSLPPGIDRLKRHDFLNRTGLNVERLISVLRCPKPKDSSTCRGVQDDDSIQNLGSVGTEQHCWVAYGDGYLDQFNADKVADATARLQMQFALALSAKDGEMVRKALGDCGLQVPQEKSAVDWLMPGEVPQGSRKGWSGPFTLEDVDRQNPLPKDDYEIRLEGQYVVHVHKKKASKDGQMRVDLKSFDFDVDLAIRGADTDQYVRGHESDDGLSTYERATIDVVAGKEYEIRVTSTPPGRWGEYSLFVEMIDADTLKREKKEPNKPQAPQCRDLMQFYRLLDPTPWWTFDADQQIQRKSWSKERVQGVARAVVLGAQKAVMTVAHYEEQDKDAALKLIVKPVSSGRNSSSQLGVVDGSLLGNPFSPCDEAKQWSDRRQPLCATRGREYAFGRPDASLWRPILTVWPSALGDISVIDGEDAFNVGLAAQVVFGGGLESGFDEKVPWGISGFFGFGFSFRTHGLFPARENRAVVETNITVAPTATYDARVRYALPGFVELRVPVIPLILVWIDGISWQLEFGPLGARYYFVWPNLIPGGEGAGLGWDVELINYRLSKYSGPRTSAASTIMDVELRMRLGWFDKAKLLGSENSGTLWTVGAEVVWGHSTFFNDL